MEHPKIYTENIGNHSFLLRSDFWLKALVPQVEDCDFILLPFPYEIIYDYSDSELLKYNIDKALLDSFKLCASNLNELSVSHNKPLIVTFYRDHYFELPFENSLVIRTSTRRAYNRVNEWGLPAFVEHYPGNTELMYREKKAIPSITFRGDAAPIHKNFRNELHKKIINLKKFLSGEPRQQIIANEGYLARRAAVVSCIKSKGKCSISYEIKPSKTDPFYKEKYLQSFRENDYVICSSGFGNYSYRLYETMKEGRIPIFIDTDSLLPCDDVLDWKKLTIWIEYDEVKKTAEKVLDFHNEIHPDDFLQLQINIRKTWEAYFTTAGFARYTYERLTRLINNQDSNNTHRIGKFSGF